VNPFTWRDGRLHADSVPLEAIAAAAGTPTYVYSATAIREAHRRMRAAFAPLDAELHYAVKANPNLELLRLLHRLGCGMDVVSGGELERTWRAGVPRADVVFAGVGKSDDEIRAALDARGPVGRFNVESVSELERIAAIAGELGRRARFCLRVNPNVDPHTHEYTTTGKMENKFGIDADRILAIVDRFATAPALEFEGLHLHIGSPVPSVEPYVEAVAVALGLIDDLAARGHRVVVLNLGGGWPVPYVEGSVPPIEEYAARLIPLLAERVRGGLRILLEPGRWLVASAGLLLIRVQHVKRARAKTFAICDGGMQTLLRPALYRAFHFAWPVAWSGPAPRWAEDSAIPGLEPYDLVGPICETGDFLARDRRLPELRRGDLVAVFSAGAYGMAMASNYNDHGRPAEVLVDGESATLINERQSLDALLATERAPRELLVPSPSGKGPG
jgi:diaminopimelate decarboxylase